MKKHVNRTIITMICLELFVRVGFFVLDHFVLG